MKRIVKLTENDLSRIVRRVIKEQDDDDTEDFINHVRNNRDQMNVIKSDLKSKSIFHIEGADTRTATRLLKNYIKFNKGKARFIAITDCEGVDLSDIDFCEFPELNIVNLMGTPNNFEETQVECYVEMKNDMYDFTDKRMQESKRRFKKR
jgi:hypothetical protein